MFALASITLVLVLMLALIYKRVSLNLTVLAGVLLTSILFGRGLMLPYDALNTILAYDTLSLMLMVYLVFFLNNFLSNTGIMKNVVESLEKMLADTRLVVMAIPALIGLIPSPSGAILSAPFTDEVGKKSGVTKERRFLINYWFRHISEYVNPTYPGILLAAGLLGVSFHSFFISNLPVMVFYTLVGIFFYVWGIRKETELKVKEKVRTDDLRVIVKGVVPIFVAVLLPVVFKASITVSLSAAILCAILLNIKVKTDFRKIERDSFRHDLLILVFLVMLFKTVLDKSNATRLISTSFIELGVPSAFLLIVIPMLAGFLTGLTIGYVGLSFPILMPFFEVGGRMDMNSATLAFVCGYLGVLLSPMHLCFSVTQKYFNADLRESYRMLLPPVILTFLWTLAWVTLR